MCRTFFASPLVSIIVPIYSAEQWLKKCLDTIQGQTFVDWECILVDDGSPDNCGKICDEYAQNDKRFHVIHQKNGGVSVARQAGLDFATGEYIIHCDPDDWIEPTMLEEMYNQAKKNDADMVIADFWVDKNERRILRKQESQNQTSENILISILDRRLHGSCWNKLIRRECIRKYNVSFRPTDLCYCEDELFCCRLLINKIKIVYIPKAFYHYVQHGTGLSFSLSERSFISLKSVVQEYSQLLEAENIDSKHLYVVKRRVMFHAFQLKKYNILKSLYPEIHEQIFMLGYPYNYRCPIESCLALALKGYSRLANTLYSSQKWIVQVKKKAAHIIFIDGCFLKYLTEKRTQI